MLYGLFWWVWGGLTLFPLLLRQPPDWTLTFVTAQFPSLVGHLLYGAGLGLFLQYLDSRSAVHWRRRATDSAEPMAALPTQSSRYETPAPAFWAVTLLLGILLPLLLGVNAP